MVSGASTMTLNYPTPPELSVSCTKVPLPTRSLPLPSKIDGTGLLRSLCLFVCVLFNDYLPLLCQVAEPLKHLDQSFFIIKIVSIQLKYSVLFTFKFPPQGQFKIHLIPLLPSQAWSRKQCFIHIPFLHAAETNFPLYSISIF